MELIKLIEDNVANTSIIYAVFATPLNKAENNKLIIKRNNLQSPIYVGDTQGDCNSAKEAGIPFVYCKYGFGKDVNGYDYAIDKFEDLLELF